MHVPSHLEGSLGMPNSNKNQHLNDKKWIFIPSHLRQGCGFFDWKETGINNEKTQRVLVVLPSQFDDYVKHCGNTLPILRLPGEVLGVGYARYWIVKMAIRMGLKYVFMFDDNVECFCENAKPEEALDVEQHRLSFEVVLTEMQRIVDQGQKYIAALSPARWNDQSGNCVKKPYSYRAPQKAICLNIRLIKERSVQYRPELASKMEDIVFAGECVKKGLTVCVWNGVVIKSVLWPTTGTRAIYLSPSPSKKVSSTCRRSK